MDVFEKPKITETKAKKRDIPRGLWVKCKDCGEMIFAKELQANLKVCQKCDYHFPMTAAERKVIHLRLKDDRRVETVSEGQEPHRSVVIVPRDKS